MNRRQVSAALICSLPSLALAGHMSASGYSMSTHWVGLLSLAIFALALVAVTLEEFIELRKSKPMLFAAGAIWGLIGWYAHHSVGGEVAEAALKHSLLQYAELMLFILVVMTYINALAERRAFLALRTWVAHRRYSYRHLFWTTGLTTFFLSPFLDNLSTALLMGAVILNLERENQRFVTLSCINIVIASNSGGAFSPFGDLTTLMVWQQDITSTTGRVDFFSFFALFLPSLISYLVPAGFMHFAIPDGRLTSTQEPIQMRRGAKRIMGLFLLTIATAVFFQGQLFLPATIGVMTGLSYLQFFGFFLKKTHKPGVAQVTTSESPDFSVVVESRQPFDVFLRVARSEWDTLLFLCGVILCVGGLGYLGYLTLASELLYVQWGATAANISIGVASSVLENIPTMSVVLSMRPEMSLGQWLLVTLTAGIGGSLLSIGSAAGVALMGQAKGRYTFFAHLQWTPAIALGFMLSVACHLWLNANLF
ncbi:MAG: sodium:proton antiporter NhaD [Candidatus Thiodiazotropha sp. (ex Dulcina madagascariensis)]|nr:sodium:proton antiporter NhaD [Candidatus Thiodiazotropha sp. (ex Dulcina madagascariensis)]MCU7928531.1 sodium:proton antiporter NhaD [Candidatus Thiodiazotropha sp. (ex Dulcina madagascariensis)]